MKYSVSTYSFSRLLQSKQMDIFGVVKKVKDMGFDCVEISSLGLQPGETPTEKIKQLKPVLDEIGLPVCNLAAGGDFLNNDFDKQIEDAKQNVRNAVVLGAPSIRQDATVGYKPGVMGPKDFDSALPILVKGYKEVVAYAKEQGIRVMIENHGHFCQDSERVEKLICTVNDDNFGACLDIGNFVCVDEDPGHGVGILAPYAMHVHAKDFFIKSGAMIPPAIAPGEGYNTTRGGNYLRGTIVGHGDVPVYQCLRILRKWGYDGVLSIEFEGMEDNVRAIGIGLANLKRFVEMLPPIA